MHLNPVTRRTFFSTFLLLSLVACGDSDDGAPWQVLADERAEALLAVSGTAANDVFAVGADAGDGPLVLHWDGSAWRRLETGTSGALWWVHAFAGEAGTTAFFGGAGGQILRYEDGVFERMAVPGLALDTVFGLWGTRPDDVWAVGGVGARAGFVWHYDGSAWRDVPLPLDVPRVQGGELPGLFKVWGADDGSAVIVGAGGTVLRGEPGGGELRVESTGFDGTYFTVAGSGGLFTAVGGDGNGVIYERDAGGVWTDRSPSGVGRLQGVFIDGEGAGLATGARGALLERRGNGEWALTGPDFDSGQSFNDVQSFHAGWIDPEGGRWAVGGNVLTQDLDRGILVYRGAEIPVVGDVGVIPPEPPEAPRCPEDAIDPAAGRSIARRWNEQILGAIRRDIPRPTVHARNLFHVSAAMYDAWAAYGDANPLFVDERSDGDGAARDEAISYAAFRVLRHRYDASRALQPGSDTSQACFVAFMEALGYDPNDETLDGDSARALGNRIGQGVIDAASDDGANEASDYADSTDYAPVSPPMIVDLPGTTGLENPFRWQELDLAQAVTQNGILLQSGLQEYIGPHWRDVRPFAIERPAAGALYFDPGEPLLESLDDLRPFAVEVIEKTAALAVDPAVTIDASPGGYGNNSLGADDGVGHPLNPITGAPYEAQPVPAGDLFRILAEYWADGPESETPPGHWNVIANEITGDPRFERRLFGEGDSVDALEWDVRLYLALNGAVHDAAIVAWELKREYTSARPITLIRYMAERGQSSDPAGPSYSPEGLPIVPGLIEVITEASSAPGERHFHLRHFVGDVAVVSWRGTPVDTESQVGGVDWIRGVLWIPYQRETFVTPSFPGYTSGHSTFSRAAAVVLAELTGSPNFPGGLGERLFPQNEFLSFEVGPSVDVRLQWSTYFDAADQAGQSRLYGGIHVVPDDYDGRITGQAVGEAAVARVRSIFEAIE
ncbi:MAG: vanadium-dependent haloperoxidase [Myxococcota bacterium]